MKVEAVFMTLERANQVLSKLKSSGFTNAYVQIDDNNRNIRRNLANKDSVYSLSNLIIDPSETKKWPLTSISPIVNVTGGFSEFNDNHYKIIVEADISSVMNAKDIIKSLGGKIVTEGESIGRVNEEVSDLNETFKNNGI